jgi:hypothetical protein
MDCPRPRSSKSSSSIWTTPHWQVPRGCALPDRGESTGPPPSYVPPWWGYVVAPGGRGCRLDHLADGVHKVAGVVPRHGDLLSVAEADPGWHLHRVALGHVCHFPALGDHMALAKHLQQAVGVVGPCNGLQPDKGRLPPVPADLVPLLLGLIPHLPDLMPHLPDL